MSAQEPGDVPEDVELDDIWDAERVDLVATPDALVEPQEHDASAVTGEQTAAAPRGVGRVAAVARRAMRRSPAELVLAAAILVWLVVFTGLVWQRHSAYGTFDFDLGHHDQAIWLLAHGKGFDTVSGMPVLGHHMTLAYFALAPAYWLGGGPQLLGLLQAAALSLAAIPVFLYARDRLGNEWQALGLAAVWLLNPSVQWLLWETWHPETMAIPFLLAAFLNASRGRRGWYWFFLIAAMSWKEDISLAVMVFALVLMVRGRRRLGLWTLLAAGLWFVLAYGVVMPRFNGGTNQAGIFYGDLGRSPTDLIKTAVTHPGKIVDRLQSNNAVKYARDLLAQFGFGALASPLMLLVAVPQFFANALTNADFFYDIRFHYAAVILCVLMICTIEGVARFRRVGLRRFGIGLVVACALATNVAWGISPISKGYRSGYWPLNGNARQQTLDTAIGLVPRNASVAATYNLVPHLSHREQIYTFPNPWIPANWGVAGCAPHDPNRQHVPAGVDWLVLEVDTHTPGGREDQLLNALLTDGEFQVDLQYNNVLVAHRIAAPEAASQAVVAANKDPNLHCTTT